MSYLAMYNAVAASDPGRRIALVSGWLRTDWRPFFEELRRDCPVLATPTFTLVTRFDDVEEVLTRSKVFSVRLYAPKMDPVVQGPFMLARDDTAANWREKSLMRSILHPEDLPEVRALAGRLADESMGAAAAEGRIDFAGGPFPERFQIALGTASTAAPAATHGS